MSRCEWKESYFSSVCQFSKMILDNQKSHGDLLSKIIVNTLGSGDLRCGPPSVLLKVRNWKLPDLPVVRIIHVLCTREVYQADFTSTYQNVSYTCGFFTLRHLLKSHVLWIG